jgi:hypothetical protein
MSTGNEILLIGILVILIVLFIVRVFVEVDPFDFED